MLLPCIGDNVFRLQICSHFTVYTRLSWSVALICCNTMLKMSGGLLWLQKVQSQPSSQCCVYALNYWNCFVCSKYINKIVFSTVNKKKELIKLIGKVCWWSELNGWYGGGGQCEWCGIHFSALLHADVRKIKVSSSVNWRSTWMFSIQMLNSENPW